MQLNQFCHKSPCMHFYVFQKLETTSTILLFLVHCALWRVFFLEQHRPKVEKVTIKYRLDTQKSRAARKKEFFPYFENRRCFHSTPFFPDTLSNPISWESTGADKGSGHTVRISFFAALKKRPKNATKKKDTLWQGSKRTLFSWLFLFSCTLSP